MNSVKVNLNINIVNNLTKAIIGFTKGGSCI